MPKCSVEKVVEGFNTIEGYSRSYGLKRQSKGVVSDFFFSVLDKGMGMESHLNKTIKVPGGKHVRPWGCATLPGSKNECDVVGTFFIGSGEDYEPVYPSLIPESKIDQLATFMRATGAKFGMLAGQTRISSSYHDKYYADPVMIRIYDKPPSSIADRPAISLPLDKFSSGDARHLCDVLGTR